VYIPALPGGQNSAREVSQNARKMLRVRSKRSVIGRAHHDRGMTRRQHRHGAQRPRHLELCSLVTVWADSLAQNSTTMLRPNAAAWYRMQEPTFSHPIAAVRRVLWSPPDLSMSRQDGDTVIMPIALVNRVFRTLCLAA
jgi:hypothetical protein